MSEHVDIQVHWRSRVTHRVLEVIDDYKTRHPWSPDIREIGAALEISSTSVVNYHLDHLEEAGLINFHYITRRRGTGRHRAARTVHITPKGRMYLKQTKSVKNHDDVATPAT